MALLIVKSTGDFHIRYIYVYIYWNVLSMPFSDRENGKLLLGLSDFYHNYQ